MSKRCAKCEKIVYPTEELKCLDKVWHKGCFKCESCGMTLNMKNYKGYDKKPYCNAHYPTTKFTAVADTPEFARIAQNSKIQSNIQYHEDFEKSKGKYTSVADDPEVLRLLKNTKNTSLIQYHSEFVENLGKKTSIADDPETLRNLKNQQNVSQIKYHEDFEKNIKGTKTNVVDDPETLRLQQQSKLVSQVEYQGLKKKHDEMERQRASVTDDVQPTQISRRPESDLNAGGDAAVPSPYTAKFAGHSTTYGAGGKAVKKQGRFGEPSQQPAYYPPPQQQQPQQQQQSPRHSYQQQQSPRNSASYQQQQQQQQQQSPRNSGGYQQQQSPRQSYQQQSPRNSYQQQQPQSPRQAAPPPRKTPLRKRGPLFQAMYDYEAQDDDEISFRDGDAIIDTEAIDEGWMYGTVERTGKRGMLPANYVERVQ